MDYEDVNPDQLITACGILESTLINLIEQVEAAGIDPQPFRSKLNDAHMAVDEISF